MSKGGTKCQRNQNDHVLLLVETNPCIPVLDVFVRSMPKRKLLVMKNIREILKRGSVTVVHGKEYVTVTSQPILCVKSAKGRES